MLRVMLTTIVAFAAATAAADDAAATSAVSTPTPLPSIPRACVAPHDHLPFCNTSLSLAERVDDLIGRLALPDKALLLTARASPRGNVSAIGLPEYNWGANCVHGVQSTCGTHCPTSFPNPVNLGAIFDPGAVEAMARVIGWELRALWREGARENYARGPHLGLDCWSPNLNINRDPRWGRNMETPSEDPLVNARYGVAYTRGLQEGPDQRYLQAIVTLKHWLAYSLEHYDGVDRTQFDAVVSAYDLADTYLPAFRAAVVDGQARGIMCSYNSVNGVPTCASEAFTHGLLREHLGFDGYMTSDSGAIDAIFHGHHYTPTLCEAAAKAIASGTDINSGGANEKCLVGLVKDHQLEEAVVDAALRRTLALRFRLGLFDPIEDQPYWHVPPTEVNKPEHQQLSLELTRKSIVLLQNQNNVLPLRKGLKLAVLGPHALAREGLMGNYYGQICHGAYHELGCVQTPFEAILERNGVDQTICAAGCDVNGTSTAGFADAEAFARDSDAVVLFLGIDTTIEREPLDRQSITLPGIQLQLLKRIRRIGKPTVVVLFNGGVLGVEEIRLHADALLEAFYPGFYGARAIAELLFGDENPSGKLPVTMYRSNYVDTVPMMSMSMTAYPGRSYRYFKEVPVFPFGWGLSYTRFELRHANSSVTAGARVPPTTPMLRLDRSLNVTLEVTVANVGSRAGDEVLLAFFRPLSVDITGPATLLNQQLFDYRRVHLPAGATTTVVMTVTDETLALVTDAGERMSVPGFYELILTNGVHERLTFAVHVATGAPRVLQRLPAGVSNPPSALLNAAPRRETSSLSPPLAVE